ncbi:MAG: AAA family ATPase [Nanobdellota archaeon]
MNPFETDPLKTKFDLIDREDEAQELIYRVRSGDMALVEGPRGSGKTHLLAHVIDNFRGKGKVIYVDGKKLSKRLDINDLIYNRPKGMILLLDNVKNISKRNNEKIKYAFDQERIRSVVFTTDNRKELTLTDSILERINDNVIKLEGYNHEMVRDIISSRGIEAPDEVINKAYELNGNVKDVILSLAKASERSLEEGREQMSVDDVPLADKEGEDESDYCGDCGAKLVIFSEVYRCPYCDVYCQDCGTQLTEEDTVCPECGEEVR